MATILFLAEDDPLMSGMYVRAFKANNFELKVAYDGENIVEILKAMPQKPAVVILDVMMPKKSGFDVLKELKEDPSMRIIPVMLLTNLSGEKDIKNGLELGADMVLVKSQYSSKEIVLKVKEVISNHEIK